MLLAWSLGQASKIQTRNQDIDGSIDREVLVLKFKRNIFKMVDLSDPKSHEKFSVDVKLLLVPGIILLLLVGKSIKKLYSNYLTSNCTQDFKVFADNFELSLSFKAIKL